MKRLQSKIGRLLLGYILVLAMLLSGLGIFGQVPATVRAAGTLPEAWVSVNGDDSNDGSEASPFKTIQKGVDSIADDGTVHLKSGTFEMSTRVNVTDRNNVRIVGEEGTKIITTVGYVITVTNSPGTVISGIYFISKFMSDETWPIQINASDDAKIKNCVFERQGEYGGGIHLLRSNHALILNNTFLNLTSAAGILNQGSTDAAIVNNVMNIQDVGIGLYAINGVHPTWNVIFNNTFSGAVNGAILFYQTGGDSANNYVFNNIFNNSPIRAYNDTATPDIATIFANNIFKKNLFSGAADPPAVKDKGNALAPYSAYAAVLDLRDNFDVESAGFVSASDLHLQNTSPAVNTGHASGAIDGDRDNNPRDSQHDIGAYERQPSLKVKDMPFAKGSTPNLKDMIVEALLPGNDADQTDNVVIDPTGFDTNTVGEYTINFSLTFEGNTVTASAIAKVKNTPPILEVKDIVAMSYEDFLLFDLLSLVTLAWDAEDGDLSYDVAISVYANVSAIPGDYVVTFTAIDSNDAETTKTATVRILATPTLTVEDKTIFVGDVFVPRDMIVEAFDGDDNSIDLISSVAITAPSDYDLNVPGTYVFSFRVQGRNGFEATATATLTIEEVPIDTGTVDIADLEFDISLLWGTDLYDEYVAKDREVKAYDVRYLVNGNEQDPFNPVEVRLPIPADWDLRDVSCWHLNAYDSWMDITQIDGYVRTEGGAAYYVFDQGDFSLFILLGNILTRSEPTDPDAAEPDATEPDTTESDATEAPGDDDIPPVGSRDNSTLWILLGLTIMLLALGAALILLRRQSRA
ncbi:MAG: DUF1565 domain-containing protein [Clostridiaceae bacterium]|nr:DUF1565 domain-containing protein [Clostridiaceae bacterium]